jgi:hypothetical protein
MSDTDYHFGNSMRRLYFGLLTARLRTFLGLGPDLEAGTERQKHGGVVLGSLPGVCSPIPMADELGNVLSALLRMVSSCLLPF